MIVVLLLRGSGLVKTRRFAEPKYLGDAINTVRLLNDKGADELLLLNVGDVGRDRTAIDFGHLEDIAGEAFMPVGYGGGLRTIEQIRRVLRAGYEKVVINSAAAQDPELVTRASREFGRQSIAVSVDVKTRLLGKKEVFIGGGKIATGREPVEYCMDMASLGAGEIVLNSIHRDGMMSGYDLPLIHSVASRVSIPVVAVGGAGGLGDFTAAVEHGAAAVAAGSLFVFVGGERSSVLVSYPSRSDLDRLFSTGGDIGK